MQTLLDRPDHRIVDDLGRRRFLGAVGAAGAAAFGLSGCAADDTGPARPGVAGAGFPVTVQGAFGPTVLDAPPQRVLALGNGPDADTVSGLGVRPVAITSNPAIPGGVPPWSPSGPDRPELLDTTDGLPFERIAALAPDLIVATTAYSLAADHAQLARIAPVLAYETGPNTDRWQQTTARVGQVLGRAEDAARRVAGIEARIAQARDTHPVLRGRTVTFGPVTADGTIYTTCSDADLSAAFLQQLGLTLSPKARALPESRTRGKAIVAPELLNLLDADLLLLTYTTPDPAVRAKLEASPLFAELPAVRRGSYVALDVASAVGMAFPSVLSLGYALDHIVERLAAAVR